MLLLMKNKETLVYIDYFIPQDKGRDIIQKGLFRNSSFQDV